MEMLLYLICGMALGAAAATLLARERIAAVRREQSMAREAEERRLADLERATREKMELVSASREEFTREMNSIAAKALQGATEQLGKLTAETRKADHAAASGELKARAEEIKQAVAPIAQHLKQVEQQVAMFDKERKETQGGVRAMFGSVSDELTRLRRETGSLVTALRRPQVRGAWGEMQLRNCAKAANMTANVDFHDQQTVAGEDGVLRPDMIVHLPSEADVVVDSKVPLDAYLAALDAEDDALRDVELDRHARQLRQHIDTLAGKRYHAQFASSPEFVVCFIPNEAVYCAALDRDPGLLEYGANKRVLLATPSTLIALLHACASAWRQEQLASSAKEIADSARELHQRMATFLGHFAKVGRQLGSAVDAFNQSVGSMETRVMPQLRRIEDAGAGSGKELPSPHPIDASARTVALPEAEISVEDRRPATVLPPGLALDDAA